MLSSQFKAAVFMVYTFESFQVARGFFGFGQGAKTESSPQLAEAPLYNIPLQKQYVPVSKNNKTVAYKTAYFGKIQLGTPGENFTVVFDTGSGHFVLPRTSCQSETCAKHRRYDISKSSSAVDIEHTGTPIKPDAKDRDQVVVSYGTGKITGEFVEDVVCVGSLGPDCFPMRVVLATDMTEDPFGMFEFDGVMGLSLDALRLDPKFSFFGEMVAHRPSMVPQFSVFLSRHEDVESKISFGGYDKEKTSSEIRWAPVANAALGHWQVQIKQIRIGNTVLDECADGSCHAVVDTGTSLLGVPRLATRSMHHLLARRAPSDVNLDQIDCRKVPGHSIDFDLGDLVVSLPVEDYSRPAPINMTNADKTSSSLICRSLLLPVDMAPPLGPKLFIWGEPVLRRYLTVYDLAQKRVGFSLARQPVLAEVPQRSSGGSLGAPPEGSLLAGAPLPKMTV
jgi:hypothetical protein